MSKHPALIHVSDMREICKPLNRLHINYFSQARITHNKDFAVQCSHPGFLEHYLSNCYYHADINMANENQLGSYVLWDGIEVSGTSHKLNQEAAEYGVKHTFTIIERHQDATDYFHFSSDLIGSSINNVYLSNIDLLKVFIQYFKEKVNESPLKEAYKVKFRLERDDSNFLLGHHSAEIDRPQFLNDLKSSTGQQDKIFYYKNNALLAELTKRQIECLRLYTQGKTAKMIAAELNLSCRTIENYLSQVKEKLGVSTKAELILRMN